MKILKQILLMGLSIILFSCASDDQPKGKTQAEVLYKESKELVEDGRYILATEKLNQIKSQYPYSYYATYAELLLADVLYLQESYPEASAAYTVFRDFHPKYKELDYVIYKIALSYFKQIPDTYDRDLTAAVQAINFFEELNLKYPGNKYEDEAKVKSNTAKKMIQDKEQYIADFYFKTHVYSAARYRYFKILREFNDPTLLEHAKKRIVLASLKLKESKKCAQYFNQFKAAFGTDSLKDLADVSSKCK